MKPKHSPAPWTIRNDYEITAVDGTVVIEINDTPPFAPEEQANHRLLVNAPRLLAALAELVALRHIARQPERTEKAYETAAEIVKAAS